MLKIIILYNVTCCCLMRKSKTKNSALFCNLSKLIKPTYVDALICCNLFVLKVDRNVSRHLPVTLVDKQWDVLILHYLGLDHIGHLGGPDTPLVGQKLEEMDEVVQQIYEALNQVRGPCNFVQITVFDWTVLISLLYVL